MWSDGPARAGLREEVIDPMTAETTGAPVSTHRITYDAFTHHGRGLDQPAKPDLLDARLEALVGATGPMPHRSGVEGDRLDRIFTRVQAE